MTVYFTITRSAIRDLSDEGQLYTFNTKQLMEFPETAAEQLLPGQTVMSVRTGDTDRPSLYKSRSPGHALSARLGRML